jgi:hypothetical protein
MIWWPAPARKKKIASMLASKLLDLAVLFEIRLGLILDIMVQGHDDLAIIVDLSSANIQHFYCNRPTIVMRHTDMRYYRYIVAGFDLLALCDADRVALDDLLGERLGRSGGRRGREEVRGVG